MAADNIETSFDSNSPAENIDSGLIKKGTCNIEFQAGTLVVFSHAIDDPSMYKFRQSVLLTTNNKPSKVSYSVFNSNC
jgi:hypothetical protein